MSDFFDIFSINAKGFPAVIICLFAAIGISLSAAVIVSALIKAIS